MKYTPKYKIKSVKFTHKGKQYDVKSSDILSGVYEYEKGGKLKDYTYGAIQLLHGQYIDFF